jgi:hypothetical protein
MMALTPSTRITGASLRAILGENAMNSTTSHHALGYSLAIVAAAGFVIGCSDGGPAGPNARSASPSYTKLSGVEAQAASNGRFPDLGSCTQLQIPEGSNVSFHVFGVGVQIYRWDGVTWKFSNPEANLYADAGQNALVGTHFSAPGANPNWLTVSGSRVIGTVVDKCTPNANAIAWVKLSADNSGTGVFNHTTFIQRLNTVGGLAPTAPGSFVGQEARSPYTADYFFYRP